MAVISADEIYRVARLAGFTPDQAVTMTAMALAESGGNTMAHNTSGEDSRGLWQINAPQHPQLNGQDLFDPLTNARAAYDVSRQGGDISPWTTSHGIGDAKYLQFRDEAELAARMAGEAANGMWNGVEGYGDRVGAAGTAGGGEGGNGSDALATFLAAATSQEGDPYVWGAEADADEVNPDAFDCSELVQWAAGRAGVEMGDGTWNQYLSLKGDGMTMSVEEAMRTPGALLFRFSSEPVAGGGRPTSAHVAISLGDGRTIEAAGRRTGVIYGEADNGYTHAGVIPGISDGTGGASAFLQTTTAAAAVAGIDTDRDGITDAMELQLGLDPNVPDTDLDGLSDGFEVLRSRSNPVAQDTDGDGISDSEELSAGTDLLNPDTDLDGVEDGATGPLVDVDADSLSDRLEVILGTDVTRVDSDGDGFTDGAEHMAGFDPLSASSSPLVMGADGVGGLGGLDDPALDLDAGLAP